ncbi:hypothetical protein KC19_VG281000 [Ceratodon purpureus]|uniref:Uncharacterized protein n=1 Tax=Ceratodon purpureus TaxID=3225 RepID=A0A8T0HVC5_CERPU|nr:hypothetical protein KC19_VG281000 [Ceratodon purpureus]
MDNQPEVDQSPAPLRPTAMPVDGSHFGQPYAFSRPAQRPGAMAGIARPPPAITSPGASQAKQGRKDRGPNWLPQKILVLIRAKREQYLE